MSYPHIAFIGGGHLAQAIVNGLLSQDWSPSALKVSCRSTEGAAAFEEATGLACVTDNHAVLKDVDYVFLTVRPRQLPEVLAELAQHEWDNDITLITVIAGIRLEHYRAVLGEDIRIIRCLPNLAASCQQSVSGLYCEDDLDEDEREEIESIMAAFGSLIWLEDETALDAMVGLSGSGIALFFKLMQAMEQAGLRYGFEKDDLNFIIRYTAAGAVGMICDEDDFDDASDEDDYDDEDDFDDDDQEVDFKELCNKIATPNGTTAAALEKLKEGGFDQLIASAMDAAVKRCADMDAEYGASS